MYWPVKSCVYWVMMFLYFVSLILLIGSGLGALLYVIFGKIFSIGSCDIMILIKKGAWAGFRYSGVWAGGLSIVLCFLRGARRRKAIDAN